MWLYIYVKKASSKSVPFCSFRYSWTLFFGAASADIVDTGYVEDWKAYRITEHHRVHVVEALLHDLVRVLHMLDAILMLLTHLVLSSQQHCSKHTVPVTISYLLIIELGALLIDPSRVIVWLITRGDKIFVEKAATTSHHLLRCVVLFCLSRLGNHWSVHS